MPCQIPAASDVASEASWIGSLVSILTPGFRVCFPEQEKLHSGARDVLRATDCNLRAKLHEKGQGGSRGDRAESVALESLER